MSRALSATIRGVEAPETAATWVPGVEVPSWMVPTEAENDNDPENDSERPTTPITSDDEDMSEVPMVGFHISQLCPCCSRGRMTLMRSTNPNQVFSVWKCLNGQPDCKLRWARMALPMEIAEGQIVCPRCQRYVMYDYTDPEGNAKYICGYDVCLFNFPKDRVIDMIDRTKFEPGPLHMHLPQPIKDLMTQ